MANFALHLSGGAANANPFQSNGGSISNTIIETDKLHNLWPEITAAQADNGWVDGKIVYWKNTDAASRKATQIRVYFRQVDNYVTMSVSNKPPSTPEELLPVIPPPLPPEQPPPTAHGEKLSYASEQLEGSSQESENVIQNVNDNNLGTWWSNGQSLPGWIKIDFQQKKRVNLLKIAWYRGDERVMGFNIQLSDDDSAYTTVFTGSSTGQTLAPEIYEFADKDARYIKVNVTSNSQISRAAITEIEVWGSNTPIVGPQQPGPGQPPPPPPGQVPGKPVEYQLFYDVVKSARHEMKLNNGVIAAGNLIEWGISPYSNYFPNKLEFYLKKTGSPTGEVVCKIWRKRDNFVVAEIARKTIADIPTSQGAVTFENVTLSSPLLTTDFIIGVEHSGGDNNNYVSVFMTDVYDTLPSPPGTKAFVHKGGWIVAPEGPKEGPGSVMWLICMNKAWWNRGPCSAGAAANPEGFAESGFRDDVITGNIDKPHSYETGIPLPDLTVGQWKGVQLMRTIPNATEKAVNVAYEIVLECKFV